jgi:hypothetical protein
VQGGLAHAVPRILCQGDENPPRRKAFFLQDVEKSACLRIRTPSGLRDAFRYGNSPV